MTTVVPHLRLSWGGSLGSPAAEIWTNTLKWANDQSLAPTRAALVGAAEAVAVPLAAWITKAESQISAFAFLEWVKLNYIQADGKQRDTDTVLFEVSPSAHSTRTNPQPMWISTYAITLRTGLSRGRGSSGRIFPPACGDPSQYLGDSGYLGAGVAGTMATSFGTCIRDVRNAMNAALGLEQPPFLNEGVAYDAVVISATTKEGDTRPPQSNEIVSVVVDRVPDVQHRRSNRLARAEGTTVVIADIP